MTVFLRDLWREQNDITYRGTYGKPQLNSLRIQRGKLPTVAINANSSSNSQGIGIGTGRMDR